MKTTKMQTETNKQRQIGITSSLGTKPQTSLKNMSPKAKKLRLKENLQIDLMKPKKARNDTSLKWW